MNLDTPLLRTSRSPRFHAVRLDSETSRSSLFSGMQNQSATSSRRTWGTKNRYGPYDQRFRKRRRVDSRPRAESSTSSASSSASSISSSAAASSSLSSVQSSTSKSGSISSTRGFSSHSTSSTRSSQSHSSSQFHSSTGSSSATRSSSRPIITVSRTFTSSASSILHPASTSVFLSTVIATVSGSTTTVVATSSGTLGASGGGGTPFSHNVGGIVGVAIGGVIALILGAALLFFTCKRFRQRHASPAAEVELAASRAPAEAQPAATDPQPPPAAMTNDGESGYHYRRASSRPQMPPTPPSSSSMAGLLGRLRGGRASTSSTVPALESTTPLALPSPALHVPAPRPLSSPHSLASPRMPGTPPLGSPRLPSVPQPPGSPRPSSLLNPRINIPSAPPSPAPEWVGWRPPAAEPPAPAPQVPTPPEDPPRSPVGLLRPSLAVLQFQSTRTLGDHEDYSRPIGGRVNERMASDVTVQSTKDSEREEEQE